MSTLTDLFQIRALGPSGAYRARARNIVCDVSGHPVAELSVVPSPFVSRAMSALRKAKTPELSARLDAIRRAGDEFINGTVAGLTASDYAHLVSRISGLGITEVRSGMAKIGTASVRAYEDAQYARPIGVVDRLDDPQTKDGCGVWMRRGEVFGVHAAGNHPAVHANWLQALALGYRVAVRPSRREPVTPHRLVSALWDAGFAPDQLVMLPTDYEAADEMLLGCDLAMAYGGQNVIEKYAQLKVLPRGPGRSKILVTKSVDWRDQIDLIVDSAAKGGGVGCTNVTSVLVEGDRDEAAELAGEIAARLSAIPSLPPEDENAVLPVHSLDSALAIGRFLLRSAQDATPILGGNGIVDDLGDGSAVLRPAVNLLSSANDVPKSGIELAFPCVWVAPWSPSDGIEPLRNTLNFVLMTDDESLIERAVSEPSITSTYVGAVPTYFSAPNVPHDGYLSGFLMESKGFIKP